MSLKFKVQKLQDVVCVTIKDITSTTIPIGCKYVNDVYLNSIYDLAYDDASGASLETNDSCLTIGACSKISEQNSHALLSFSASVVECVRLAITRIISGTLCNNRSDSYGDYQSTKQLDSMMLTFQLNMREFVVAVIALYLGMFGMKILIGSDNTKPSEILLVVLKIGLVTYFAIGNSSVDSSSGQWNLSGGMTDIVFPLLFSAMTEMASWMIYTGDAAALCYFTASEYVDSKNIGEGYTTFSHLALWDWLDCRMAKYVGIDPLLDITLKNNGKIIGDNLGYSIPPYILFIIPAVYFGFMSLAMLILSYPILVVSSTMYIIGLFISSMIIITVLGLLSPLMFPMWLFKKTEQYFKNWASLMLAHTIQPAIAIVALVMLYNVYDVMYYGKCQYVYYKITEGNGHYRKLFAIDTNESNYSSDDFKSCSNTIGWLMNSISPSVVGNC
jgi:type IV secretion system protein VirB6